MSDLKLKRIRFRNWMKYRQLDLQIPEKGLVLVQGINSASGGALASVGSGKTSLGEAICRALFGVSGRFNTMKQYSRDKAGDCYVCVEADLLGEPLMVESGYRCKEMSPTSEALRYTYRGQTRERGRMEQTREDLATLFGVPQLLAEWSVFVDGEKLKFNKLSQADCVDLVMSALRQPPWTEYHDRAKSKLGAFKRDMQHNQTTHQEALDEVKAADEAVQNAQERLDEEKDKFEEQKAQHQSQANEIKERIESKQKRVVEAKERMKAIAKELRKMEEQRAEQSHAIEIQINEVDDKLREKEHAQQPLQEVRDKAWAAYSEAKTDHENYKKVADKCPTCQRPLGKIEPARLEVLGLKRSRAKDAYDDSAEVLTQARESVTALNEKRRTLSQKFREVSAKTAAQDLSDEHGELQESVEERLEEIKRFEVALAGIKAGPSKEGIVEAQTKINMAKDYKIQTEARLQKAAALLAEDLSMLKVLEYWNMAFSPYGVPNMVLREAIAPLNHEARRISAQMTGGTIDVRFATVREMASGLEKAQLNINVDNLLGDRDLMGASKGEGGLANYIISEALSTIGQVSKRVGFLWLDELLPNHDSTVCKAFYAYLKQKAAVLSVPIFLVTHDAVSANYADHILLVEKFGNSENCECRAGWR